jgi:hypothetical protein
MNKHTMRVDCAASADVASISFDFAGVGAPGAASARPAGGVTSFSSSGVFSGIAATSASDAWAMGDLGSGKTLIVGWNGKAWKQVPSSISTGSRLSGMAATSILAGGTPHYWDQNWPLWAQVVVALAALVGAYFVFIGIPIMLMNAAKERRKERARQSRRPHIPTGRSGYPSDTETAIRDHEIWLEQQARWERHHKDSGKLFKYWTGGG